MAKLEDRALVGVFDSADDARQAIRDLREAQFSVKDIGLLSHDDEGTPELRSFRDLQVDRAPTGAAIGAVVGAIIGVLWAIGADAGILPSIGLFVGPSLLVLLAAGAAAGAGLGVVIGALIGLGLSNESSAYHNAELTRGRTVVAVRPGGRAELVDTILRAHHARDRELVGPGSLAERIAAEHPV